MNYDFISFFKDMGTARLSVSFGTNKHTTFSFKKDVNLYQQTESEITIPKKAHQKLCRALKKRIKQKITVSGNEKLKIYYIKL